MSLVEIAWIWAVLKAPTTALESAANCVELNAPICAVVSEVPTALSWSEVKVPMSLVEIAPNWALLSVPMTVLVRPEACPVVIAAIWAVPKLPASVAI